VRNLPPVRTCYLKRGVGLLAQNSPIKHHGNESLFMGVEMSLIATLSGIPLHIHAEGLRGTGKTTIMRYAKGQMPSIRRIKGCVYQCDPKHPHCPLHISRKGNAENTEETQVPFVEVGHGAKLGTVLGSIDLTKLTDSSSPSAALLPGSIPMAHRGVLFIDEINRLAETAPEITDVLLSVMGTKPGRVKIEEVGLPPCEIEVSASVWATSNPDEDPGPLEDIRRQLADRFDLVIPVQRPSDAAIIKSMLRGNSLPIQDSKPLFDDIPAKVKRFRSVTIPEAIFTYIAELYVKRNIESIRAIEALSLSSRLACAIRGGDAVTFDDLAQVLPLVLRHRTDPMMLSEILKDLELQKEAAGTSAQPISQYDQTDIPNFPASATQNAKNSNTEDNPGINNSSLEKQDRQQLEKGQDNSGSDKIPNPAKQAEPSSTKYNESPNSIPNNKPWYRRLMSRLSSLKSNPAGQKSSRSSGPSGMSGSSAQDWMNSQTANPSSNNNRTNMTNKAMNAGHTGMSKSPSSGKYPKTSGHSNSSPTVLDPKKVPPSPPTDPARRIDLLSWEEMILTSQWKDEIH
jgi:magnesium chelatase subunit I